MSFQLEPYDPCPCGSGEKYKFCCAAKAKANRHGKFPIGTLVRYGPDDKATTKIAAAVVLHDAADPILERWHGANVLRDSKVADEIKRFFAKYGVKNVVMTDGNMGCPHQEGIDYPDGQDCPLCPFWAGKQGSTRRDDLDTWDDSEPEDDEELDNSGSEEDDFDRQDRDWDAAFARVEAILGDAQRDRDQALDALLAHLRANLQLPCEVTGIEDFRWEERYVIGGWPRAE